MSFSKFNTNVSYHQALPDRPNANAGLTADQLKMRYDQGVNDIKDFINETLTPELDSNSGLNLGITDPMSYYASGSAQTTTGSITTGLKALTVASAIDFAVGQGINLQGANEASSLQITAAATVSSNVTVTLNGVEKTVAVVSGDTAIQVATKIRAATFPGWTAGGTAGTDTVTFTSTTSGVKTDATYSAGTTTATGAMTTTTQGTADQISTVSAINGLVITIADNATRTIAAGTIEHSDNVAIQTAVNALSGHCGTLIIPNGTYNLNASIILLSTIQIIGMGSGHQGTSIVNKSGDHAFKSSQLARDAQGTLFYARILQGFQVHNLRITDQNVTPKDAFFIEGIQNNSGFFNVDMRNCRYGINTSGSWVFEIDNCQFDTCQVGILLGDKVNGPNSDPVYSLECNAVTITGQTAFANCTEAGIKYMIGNMLVVDGCTFNTNSGRGIWLLQHPNNQTVEGVVWPTVSSVTYPSIGVFPEAVTIKNNYFEHQGICDIEIGADSLDLVTSNIWIENNHSYMPSTPIFVKCPSLRSSVIKNNDLRSTISTTKAVDFTTTTSTQKSGNYVNVGSNNINGTYSINNNINYINDIAAYDDYISYSGSQVVYVDSVNGNDANTGKTSGTAIQTLVKLSTLLVRTRLNNSLTQVYFVGGSTFLDTLTMHDCGYVNFNISGAGNIIFNSNVPGVSIYVYENTYLNIVSTNKIKFLVPDVSGRAGIYLVNGGSATIDTVDFYSNGTAQNTIGVRVFEGCQLTLKGSITNNASTSVNIVALEEHGGVVNSNLVTATIPARNIGVFSQSYAATGSRPTYAKNGQEYFDTTLGKPIWRKGTVWVDGAGTSV